MVNKQITILKANMYDVFLLLTSAFVYFVALLWQI